MSSSEFPALLPEPSSVEAVLRVTLVQSQSLFQVQSSGTTTESLLIPLYKKAL
ncbi:MAG: hypothetical protein J5934_07020 [Succinivibrio sp.]|nr:hypothetical protein [Succinivibrio sp.]